MTLYPVITGSYNYVLYIHTIMAIARGRAARRARKAAVTATGWRLAKDYGWGPDNLAFNPGIEKPMRHLHCGSSKCRYCAESNLPHAQIGRLNEAAAASLADYIESSL